MTMKVMSPEQLFDSLAQVTGNIAAARGGGKKAGVAGGPKGGPVGARAQFVNFFLAGAESLSAVDYEAGIPQALRLMNSPIANNPAVVRTIVGSRRDEAGGRDREDLPHGSLPPADRGREDDADRVRLEGEFARDGAYSDILWAC